MHVYLYLGIGLNNRKTICDEKKKSLSFTQPCPLLPWPQTLRTWHLSPPSPKSLCSPWSGLCFQCDPTPLFSPSQAKMIWHHGRESHMEISQRAGWASLCLTPHGKLPF